MLSVISIGKLDIGVVLHIAVASNDDGWKLGISAFRAFRLAKMQVRIAAFCLVFGVSVVTLRRRFSFEHSSLKA